ncbi:acyltransferase [Actinomycetes bacterium]|nr:acyltransferase [Actinomycetes bacterium]
MFSGGFVGVDMFFVVSGFVIGLTTVTEQVTTGKVSFRRFFERRFFRIFPPLSFMVAVMTVYAYFIVPFTKAQDFFIQQARAALFSYGNFFFMFRELNYFVQSGDITFFLHTWSLGVEEQFYIALPIVLGVLALIGRRFDATQRIRIWSVGFVVLGLASAFTMYGASSERFGWFTPQFRQEFLFYSPFTRAWEFFLGLLVAIAVLRYEQGRKYLGSAMRTSMSVFSIVVILFVLVTRVDGNASQIGACALTALATGLLIFSLPGSKLDVQKFFGIGIFQAIGNSSYSIYLWHWIGVSVSLDLMRQDSSLDKSLLVVASILPAIISYRFIEQPFRKMRTGSTKKKVFSGLALVLIPTLMLFGLDFTKTQARVSYGNVYASTVLSGCDFLFDVCVVGEDTAAKKVLLYGDSHIHQLIPIFVDYTKTHDVQITTCALYCNRDNYPSIKDGTFAPGNFDLVINSFKTNSEEISRVKRRDLATTFSKFASDRGARHLIVLDNPFYSESVAPRRIRKPELKPLSRAEQDAVADPITQNWKDDAGEGTFFYDPFAVLCNATECPLEKDGKVLYLDNNHLSMPGVKLLEPSLINLVNQILARQ